VFYVGGSIKYLGGLLSVTLASLLGCVFIDGSLGRYRTQLKYRESALFCLIGDSFVLVGDGTAQSCFFSSPFLEVKMFSWCRGQANTCQMHEMNQNIM